MALIPLCALGSESPKAARILNLSSRQPTLEDAYIELVSDLGRVEPN